MGNGEGRCELQLMTSSAIERFRSDSDEEPAWHLIKVVVAQLIDWSADGVGPLKGPRTPSAVARP